MTAKRIDPAAEIGSAADVLAVDQAVACAMGSGYDWAVEVAYDVRYGRLVAEGKRLPYPAPLPEIVARFRYLNHAQAFVIREFEDDPKLVARVKLDRI